MYVSFSYQITNVFCIFLKVFCTAAPSYQCNCLHLCLSSYSSTYFALLSVFIYLSLAIYSKHFIFKSSVESQKGAIAIERCSIENQKGAITIETCSVENQKDAIAIDFVQWKPLLVIKGTSLNIKSTLLALNWKNDQSTFVLCTIVHSVSSSFFFKFSFILIYFFEYRHVFCACLTIHLSSSFSVDFCQYIPYISSTKIVTST